MPLSARTALGGSLVPVAVLTQGLQVVRGIAALLCFGNNVVNVKTRLEHTLAQMFLAQIIISLQDQQPQPAPLMTITPFRTVALLSLPGWPASLIPVLYTITGSVCSSA